MSSKNQPPKISAALLNWLLADVWNTPAGDFEEAFHRIAATEGPTQARRWYRRQTLTLLPDRLKEKLIWNSVMFVTNLKVSVRSLRRNPGFAAINMGGLAVGMAACILIMLFVRDELSFDAFHSKSDRIVRVIDQRIGADGQEQILGLAPPGAALTALEQIPEVESAVRMFSSFAIGRQTVETEQARFYEGAYLYVDASFFDIFDFQLLRGSAETVLSEPWTLILTESAALRYFGSIDPMGKTISLEREGDFTVTGIIEDPPVNSHVDFSMLVSLKTYESLENTREFIQAWDRGSFTHTYFLLNAEADLDVVQQKFSAIAAERRSEEESAASELILQPMQDVHFGSAQIVSELNQGEASRTSLWLFALIAAFIMFIAVINYTNMTTAGSIRRSREIGMRKAVGANRSQVARQFFSESTVLVGLALISSLFVANAALPAFNSITAKSFDMADVFEPTFIVAILGLTLLIGFLSGFYPALFLSRFNPVTVLKGRVEAKSGAPRLRQSLVVSQFALSIGLIIASLIVYQQMQYVQEMNLGFDEEQLVIVDINDGGVRANFETIVDEYASLSEVVNVSVSSRVPGDWKGISEIDVRSVDSGDDSFVRSHFISIDDRFIDTYGMSIVDGRNISLDSKADSMAVLINEAAARSMNLRVGDAVHVPGSSLRRNATDQTFEPTVVGIVKDFNFKSIHESVGPMVLGFHLNPIRAIDYFTIRLASADFGASIAGLREIGERFDPGHPFEYNILEDRLTDFYQSEIRLGKVFSLATGLAILIACLGLFGLTAFTVARRTKEIGVRKVLGATGPGVVRLLTREIVVLVGISFLVAAPLSWLAMNAWLSGFAYRIDIGLTLIVASGLISLLCAFATVSYQALKASRMDPVKSLRYE